SRKSCPAICARADSDELPWLHVQRQSLRPWLHVQRRSLRPYRALGSTWPQDRSIRSLILAIELVASQLLAQEARALLTRLARVKAFALLEPMLPAAALSPIAQT